MNFKSRKVSPIIAIALIAGAAILVGFFALYDTFIPEETEPAPPQSPFMTLQTAQDIAFEEARKWQPDAKLAGVSSVGGKINETGHSTFFRFRFSSRTVSGQAFEVDVRGREIAATRTLPLSVVGGDIPEKGLMTEEEAMAYVRTLPGYEEEEVVSAELTYDEPNNSWSWGVYTATKGVVSIDAAR